MRRRDFLQDIARAATVLPLAARAQQASKQPTIGYLGIGTADSNPELMNGLMQGLAATGYIPARNLAMEFRWANGDYGQLPNLAAALVKQDVDVIVMWAGFPPAAAAKTATTSLLAELSAQYAVATSAEMPEFPRVGGLTSYGTDLRDTMRLAGVYAGQILKGANPADLPVQEATKFDLVINLKTAQALGLQVPDKLMALADEAIE